MDLTIAIIALLLVFALAAFGGHVSSKTSGHRKVFWALGAAGVILTTVQTIRQQNSQRRFESEIRNLSETSLKTVTGGDSFCFIHLQILKDGIFPVLLNVGKYPLYDLSMRLWDTEEWKNLPALSPRQILAKSASETAQLGTLQNNDYKNIGELAIPTLDKTYSAEFSARNGSWSQTLILRPSTQGWKFATLVRKSRRVAKSDAEVMNQPRLCFFADSGFPEKEPGELKRWAQSAPKCEAGSHP